MAYEVSDLILYELPEEMSDVKGVDEWLIASSKSQWHHKPVSVIVLGYDCNPDGSDTGMIINHELLHSIIYLICECRLGKPLDYYWHKYWTDEDPPDKMYALLEGMAYSGIGFP
jgi:hypothetical protein